MQGFLTRRRHSIPKERIPSMKDKSYSGTSDYIHAKRATRKDTRQKDVQTYRNLKPEQQEGRTRP